MEDVLLVLWIILLIMDEEYVGFGERYDFEAVVLVVPNGLEIWLKAVLEYMQKLMHNDNIVQTTILRGFGGGAIE